MTKRETLKTQGWGFGVLYLGRQAADVNLTAAQGQADAQDAATLGTKASFPAETRIYLDVEQGGFLSTAFVAYIKAWLTELDTNTPFAPAVYCSFSRTADQIRTAAGPLSPRFWVFRLGCPPSPGCQRPTPAPHPTLSGITYAHAWQYAQSGLPQAGCADFTSTGNCNLVSAGRGFPVDLDTAISSNPSSG
jgi:hypothetical protein